MNPDRELLRAALEQESSQPIDASALALTAAIRQRHGDVVAAVILYGSCLRPADPTTAAEPLYDFFVLVDDYRRTYGSPALAVANRLLPPNVFYLEIPGPTRRARAKYAVVEQTHFRRLVSRRTFHSYFWARFAQPVRIAYARDAGVRDHVLDSLVEATATFAAAVGGLLIGEVTPAQFWVRGFLETYGAELRSERRNRAQQLYEFERGRYDLMTVSAIRLAGLEVRPVQEGRFAIGQSPRSARASWALRRAIGKALSVLRLAKGVFTFDGGLDYILWKIERHSGIATKATPWQRRHPLLAAPGLAWKLYRQGAFR